jgi:hypothetical protein
MEPNARNLPAREALDGRRCGAEVDVYLPARARQSAPALHRDSAHPLGSSCFPEIFDPETHAS